FGSSEPTVTGKQLELLKEAAPQVAKVALIFNTDLAGQIALSYFASIEAAAAALSVRTIQMPVRNAVGVVRAIDAFAAEPGGGRLILPPPPTTGILEAVLQLAAQHRLPAIYPSVPHAAAGGLLAYATDRLDQHRRAAAYVDRILRGAKVSELPVQFPTKF